MSRNVNKCNKILGQMPSFEVYWLYQKTAFHREPKIKHRSEQAQASLFWNPDSSRFLQLLVISKTSVGEVMAQIHFVRASEASPISYFAQPWILRGGSCWEHVFR